MILRIETLTKQNNEIIENSNHDKRVEFYEKTINFHNLWEDNSKFFYLFFNNDDIKEIEINIEKLPEHAKNGELEETKQCLVECLEEKRTEEISSLVSKHIYEGFRQCKDVIQRYPEYFKKEKEK